MLTAVLVNGKPGRMVGMWTSLDKPIPHFSQGTVSGASKLGFRGRGGDGAAANGLAWGILAAKNPRLAFRCRESWGLAFVFSCLGFQRWM